MTTTVNNYTTTSLFFGISVAERDFQERVEGENATSTRHFVITGTDNGGDAYAALMNYLSSNFDDGSGGIASYDIPLKNVRMKKKDGANVFDVVAEFEFPRVSDADPDVNDQSYEIPEIENFDYSFSTGGDTLRMTRSWNTLHRLSATGQTVRDFDGGIGFNYNGTFDGVDIFKPRVSIVISKSLPKLFFNSNYRRTLANATGCVNSATFDGFAAGCVLFKGVDARPTWFTYTDPSTGKTLKDWYWRASYRFDVKPVELITLGESSALKRGFDYVWRLTEKTEDANGNVAAETVQVNIEQVYDEFDFTLLGLPLPL